MAWVSTEDAQMDAAIASMPDEFFDADRYKPKGIVTVVAVPPSPPPLSPVPSPTVGSKRRAEEDIPECDDRDEDAVASDREQQNPSLAVPAAAASANSPPRIDNVDSTNKDVPMSAAERTAYIEKLLSNAHNETSAPVVLDGDQRKALEAALAGKNMFITGPAGSGKSALLKEIDKQLTAAGKVVNKVSYNGVAAANINGMTVHSFCGLGAQNAPPFKSKKLHSDVVTRVRDTDTLILDEFSTLSNHFFDGLDLFFRQVCSAQEGSWDLIHEPFGGIQLIVCGDFAQLKPVDDSKKRAEAEAAMKRQGDNVMRKNLELYNKLDPELQALLTEPSAPIDRPWAGKAWRYIKDNIYYLDTPHRQGADPAFLKLLNEAREGSLSDESHRILVSKISRNMSDSLSKDYVMLFSKRADVAEYNQAKLRKLPAEQGRVFKAVDHFENDFYKSLLANVPLMPELELRMGCRVMLKRNLSKGLVNGTCGVVVGFTCCPASDPRSPKGIMRPVQGLVFNNPNAVKNKWSIPNYKQLKLPDAAQQVTLRATSQYVLGRREVMDRIEKKLAEQDSYQAHVYAMNGFLPLPVVEFESGEYLVCTPTEWSIEVTRREEAKEPTGGGVGGDGTKSASIPLVIGANGEKVSASDTMKLASVSSTTPNGGGHKRGRLMPKRKKEYRLVPVKLAFRIQIPLHVAYAVSVHASIGLTLPKLCVDLGRSIFEEGQAYVALSRGTALSGIVLRDYVRSSIRADPKVNRFYATLKNRALAERQRALAASNNAAVAVGAVIPPVPAAAGAASVVDGANAEEEDDANLSDGEQFRRLMARKARQSVAKAIAAQESEFY